MADSVEPAKEVAKEAAPKEKAPRANAKSAPKIVPEPVIEAKPAPEAPKVESKPAAPAPIAANSVFNARNGSYAAVAAGALVVGVAFGMMGAPKPKSNDSLVTVTAALEAGRSESARLSGEIERLNRTVAALGQTHESGRAESKSLGSALSDRVAKLEQGLDKKLASLRETIERDNAARATGTTTPAAEKRVTAPVPQTPVAPIAAAPKSEPTHTGSLAEPKAKSEPKLEVKPDTVETWALRDVYNGLAMLEDRRRRLIEVAPGDSVPGIGRVEAIERRGRMWVVVTKQGVITPQSW